MVFKIIYANTELYLVLLLLSSIEGLSVFLVNKVSLEHNYTYSFI